MSEKENQIVLASAASRVCYGRHVRRFLATEGIDTDENLRGREPSTQYRQPNPSIRPPRSSIPLQSLVARSRTPPAQLCRRSTLTTC